MNKYKFYRQEKGLTQTKVAEIIGCSNQMISEIERDNMKPGITLAIKLAKLYGVTVETLEEE